MAAPQPLPAVRVAAAAANDEQLASAIAREASAWLADRGEAMWDREDVAPETFVSHIEAGEVHLAYVDGEAVDVVILQWEDPVYWPEAPPGESAFIHRLAVRRCVADRGVSRALLAHARRLAAQAGRWYLRLDCDGGRLSLCAFYESAGFARHSLHTLSDGSLLARYEMRLAR